ncbi:MAG TPA: hypothetical protein VGY90_08020 [Steroidobacteraceae bacterium]|jgi:hypothetical protein|nr:hypothetical protein [Steroidobacteraceae bacterium]
MPADCPDLGRFVRGEIAAASFPHREHVRIAFEMLRRHDFAETVLLFSRALLTMAQRAGKPQAFHQTLTIAFLSLIAERLEGGDWDDFAAFAHDNPDLLDKGTITHWYRPERLASERARRTFLLPEPDP